MKLLIINRFRNPESVKADISLIDTETKGVINVNKEVVALSKALGTGFWGRSGKVYGMKYSGFEESCKNTFNSKWTDEHEKAYEKILRKKNDYMIFKNVLLEIVAADYIYIDM